jgi:hypothetical protein
VKFDAPPAVKLADIKKEIVRGQMGKVEYKITSKVVEKGGEKEKTYTAGTFLLKDAAGDADDVLVKVADFLKAKKSVLVLTGVLTEDDKGKQTLELTKADEVTKPGK